MSSAESFTHAALSLEQNENDIVSTRGNEGDDEHEDTELPNISEEFEEVEMQVDEQNVEDLGTAEMLQKKQMKWQQKEKKCARIVTGSSPGFPQMIAQ